MPLYIAQSGDLDRCYRCLTDSLTHSQMKDRATQLLIKFKSGALVTQCVNLKSIHDSPNLKDDLYVAHWSKQNSGHDPCIISRFIQYTCSLFTLSVESFAVEQSTDAHI